MRGKYVWQVNPPWVLSPESVLFTVVLMLRVWVMYGKSKRIGLLLSTVFALALGTAFIVPLTQPTVRHIT
jgi:hypothetical protein